MHRGWLANHSYLRDLMCDKLSRSCRQLVVPSGDCGGAAITQALDSCGVLQVRPRTARASLYQWPL